MQELTSSKEVTAQGWQLVDASFVDMGDYLDMLVSNAVKYVVIQNKEIKVEFL